MFIYADRVLCADKMLTADDDEKVFSECMLYHTGPSNAGWHVDWIRSDTGDRLPSMKQDGAGLVKRILTLQVAYPSSAGEYVCSVTSRRPFYVDNCTLQLVVRRMYSRFFINCITLTILLPLETF